MWLPTPFYDRAPHYWLFIGALLAIVGVYLGFEGDRGFMVFGLVTGFASCAWGGRIFLRRARDGESQAASEAGAATD